MSNRNACPSIHIIGNMFPAHLTSCCVIIISLNHIATPHPPSFRCFSILDESLVILTPGSWILFNAIMVRFQSYTNKSFFPHSSIRHHDGLIPWSVYIVSICFCSLHDCADQSAHALALFVRVYFLTCSNTAIVIVTGDGTVPLYPYNICLSILLACVLSTLRSGSLLPGFDSGAI